MIILLTGVSFLNTMGSGILTVAPPHYSPRHIPPPKSTPLARVHLRIRGRLHSASLRSVAHIVGGKNI